MLDLNPTPTTPLVFHGMPDTRADDADLDRTVNALMLAMVLENADMFDGIADVMPGFDELENELKSLQANELRAVYLRVQQAETELETALAAAEAEAQAEMQAAQVQAQALEQEIARLRAETDALENEFEPRYQQLAQEMETERQRAAELRAKASALNAEARAQFESKLDMVLQARLRPFEERYAVMEQERAARRQPLEQQIASLEAQQNDWQAKMQHVLQGQSEAQKRAAGLREGRTGEGAALYIAVRELLAAREQFGQHITRIEKELDKPERMSEIAKRHASFVAQARLELDAPINAAGALERVKEGQLGDAKRLLELALRGGLDQDKANEIRQAIVRAEYAELVQAWEQDLIQRAPQINGMSTVNRYKENIAAQSREPGYQSLSRDLTRALAHAEKLAGQGVAARRRALEQHAAQYITSQNKFFSAQVMPDSGRVMIAVKKNGQWLRHALCQVVEGENGYEIKTNYYEHKTALDDQSEWDRRRERLETRLPQQVKDNGSVIQ